MKGCVKGRKEGVCKGEKERVFAACVAHAQVARERLVSKGTYISVKRDLH